MDRKMWGKEVPRRGASKDRGEVYGEACQGPFTVRFCELSHFYQAHHGSGGHGQWVLLGCGQEKNTPTPRFAGYII